MDAVTDESHRAYARQARAHLAVYEAKRDLVLLGAHEKGRDPQLDAALAKIDALEAFLRQPPGETCSFDETLEALARATD